MRLFAAILVSFLVLLAPPVLAQEFDLALLYGRWEGEGQVVDQSDGEVQVLRCRITIEEFEATSTRFRGRCAARSGNQRFSLEMREEAEGFFSAESLLAGDADRDTRAEGYVEMGHMKLVGSEGDVFELEMDGSALVLRMAFIEAGKDLRADVRLLR